MTNLNTVVSSKVSALIIELDDTYKAIDKIVANSADKDSLLSAALFNSADYNLRCNAPSARAHIMKQTALAEAWSNILNTARNVDPSLGSDVLYFASGVYYTFDIKTAVWALTCVKDVYKANVGSYDDNVTKGRGLLPLTHDNVEKVLSVYESNDIIDGHHVWSFLNKCGASRSKDVTTFNKKMTFRGTADRYGSEWVAGLANIVRIVRKSTGADFSFSECNTILRNTRVNGFDDVNEFADVFTMSVAANGNATIRFTPEAVKILNSVTPIKYDEAYRAIVELVSSFYDIIINV